jgi:hypothetical protein
MFIRPGRELCCAGNGTRIAGDGLWETSNHCFSRYPLVIGCDSMPPRNWVQKEF